MLLTAVKTGHKNQGGVIVANYEYKCVSGPKQLVVQSANDSSKAIASYADIINAEAVDGWEFYSLETMSVEQAPGCLSTSKEPPVLFNMLVFRREK